MSDKAITQIKAELEKREKYWQEWNGRAANRIAKLEYENQELQSQVDAILQMEVPKGYSAKFTHGWTACLEIVKAAIKGESDG